MDSFSKLSFSKVWILAKYGRLVTSESQPHWDVLDSKACGDPISLTITSTNCLIITSDSKIHVISYLNFPDKIFLIKQTNCKIRSTLIYGMPGTLLEERLKGTASFCVTK